MRVVIQLVKDASVEVNKRIIGNIGRGLLVFAGFEEGDTSEDIEWIARKIVRMRIFQDREQKMNLSVEDVEGQLLIISQFTLHASTKKGNRPSFMRAASTDDAEELYDQFIHILEHKYQLNIESGEFGAMMEVKLINDGPVTIFMDSKNRE